MGLSERPTVRSLGLSHRPTVRRANAMGLHVDPTRLAVGLRDARAYTVGLQGGRWAGLPLRDWPTRRPYTVGGLRSRWGPTRGSSTRRLALTVGLPVGLRDWPTYTVGLREDGPTLRAYTAGLHRRWAYKVGGGRVSRYTVGLHDGGPRYTMGDLRTFAMGLPVGLHDDWRKRWAYRWAFTVGLLDDGPTHVGPTRWA